MIVHLPWFYARLGHGAMRFLLIGWCHLLRPWVNVWMKTLLCFTTTKKTCISTTPASACMTSMGLNFRTTIRTKLHPAFAGQLNMDAEEVKEGLVPEQDGNTITQRWQECHSSVLEKYQRRIDWFRQISKLEKPIIVLCRYLSREVICLQTLFGRPVVSKQVHFINASDEGHSNNSLITNVHTEKNGIWNETARQAAIKQVFTNLNIAF